MTTKPEKHHRPPRGIRPPLAVLAVAFMAIATPSAAAEPDPDPWKVDDCGLFDVTPYGGRIVICVAGYEYDIGEILCSLPESHCNR